MSHNSIIIQENKLVGREENIQPRFETALWLGPYRAADEYSPLWKRLVTKHPIKLIWQVIWADYLIVFDIATFGIHFYQLAVV